MNKKLFVSLGIVVLLIAGGVYLYLQKSGSPEEWTTSDGYMSDLMFQYPTTWKITRHGSNTSDEATSVVRVENGKDWVEFIASTEAGIIPGCTKVTEINSNPHSETIQRILSSAKCHE